MANNKAREPSLRIDKELYEDPVFRLLRLGEIRRKFPNDQFYENVFTLFVYDLFQKLDDISYQQS